MVILLPLRAVLLQSLFLLITIALESFILQITMYLSRRTSIEYAAAINLFSTIFGWIFFFCFESLISANLRRQLINLILFGRFAPELGVSLLTIYFNLVLLSLVSFIIILFVEYVALDFVINLNKFKISLNSDNESAEETSTQTAIQKRKFDRQRSKNLLIANAYSQSIILIILFLIQRV